ncbi:porin [Corticibacter populi]|uniref:Porin n=1 Tax=Corticibacter populi TaxID=1550736 RepID=A0A3M6QYF5_9BURK|nr:porin [Corticibacter populi]RMX07639.1 porin [Corticibacter populi]RZS30140.1 putative porin [Corticibacter populi]
MNKKLAFALIPLLAAGAAQAQSSVTLYGRINTTLERQKVESFDSSTGLVSNASFIGFKGSEDLGNGLKAGFVLEQEVDATDGSNSNGFGRQSELYLSGNFGTLRLGNYNSAAYTATADYISLHNHDTGTSADALYAYIVPNTAKIGYVTPDLAGFTLELGFNPKDNQGTSKNAYDLAASYKLGNFDLGGGYAKWDDAEAYTLRALYNNGALALGGYVQYDDNGFGAGLGDRWGARLVAAYYFGASELHANVGWADDYDNLNDSAATQFTLGYNYNLSKRTKLYGFYTRVDNDSNAGYGTGVTGKDFSSFALGVRHLF